MPKIPSLHAVLQGWLLDGPLAAYVPAYVERLERAVATRPARAGDG